MTNSRYLPPSCGVSRRTVIASLAGFAAGAVLAPGASGAPLLTRPIRTSGEAIPAVGLGTWITFNVGDDRRLRDERARVLAAFFEQGGGLIDSSPMYGSSEAVIGDGLRRLSHPRGLFAATKVWTPFTAGGIDQMAQSGRLWGVERFDLMQVHNLVNWKGHLPALLEDKRAGRIRHVGITTSHGSRHDEMVRVMRSQPIDAVQFSYNILDRDAERELLPLAADRGLAVIVNRPFRTGELFERFGRHPLPDFALEFGCLTWSQFLLKFVISHPAVTCAIPATSRRDHLLENMAALTGSLPDAAMRARMIRYVESL
jgi:aryl-alcohol dehydrogenase-like predicted oxidoreductase